MSVDDTLARRAFGGVFDHAAPEVQEGMHRFVRAARLPRAWLVELVAGVAFGPGVAEEALARLEEALPRADQARDAPPRCAACGCHAAYINVYSGVRACAKCAGAWPELIRSGVFTLLGPLKSLKEKR